MGNEGDILIENICGNGIEHRLQLSQMMCHANRCPVTGSLHCVACSDQGEVFTWGDNDEGQLGDGTTNAIQMPRLVVALQVTGSCLIQTIYEMYSTSQQTEYLLIKTCIAQFCSQRR